MTTQRAHPRPARQVFVENTPEPQDAFTRIRVSHPLTIFDSKQIFDNLPLFWDDQEVSGSGTGSSHSVAEAMTTMSVSAQTAGRRVRQTFMRFNYQPGKSQQIFATYVMPEPGGAGITRRIGYFDDDNGIFFEDAESVPTMVIRSKTSGSVVEDRVPQSQWSVDRMDGSSGSRNPTSIKLDMTKTQILAIDFEWLGVGIVRVGFMIEGAINYVHTFLHANQGSLVYMSTPNLPLRYEIINNGMGGAATLGHICATVISEGGVEDTGFLHWYSTGGTHVNANVADTVYAVVGLRLKSDKLGCSILFESASMINATEDDFEWCLVLNPTLGASVTWNDIDNSCVQAAVGESSDPSQTTVTGGVQIAGGFVKNGGGVGAFQAPINNALRLGAAIDGTRDEIWLCVRPLVVNADIDGGLQWRERL